MRLCYTICQITFSTVVILLASCSPGCAQTLQPIPTDETTNEKSQTSADNDLPYKMTSRFHFQKGANKGYLVLRVELDKGNYIYSLTQKGDVRPTKIKTAPSKLFRLTGKFNPDRPATIIENDPLFNQRIEKHKGIIQFFAPVEVAPGVDVSQLTTDLAIEGQVCKESGYCMPISGLKVKGRFAGFFDSTAKKRESSQSSTDNRNVRR